MKPHPWFETDEGLWCPACGGVIANAFHIDDDYVPPEECRSCGFPDFEEGEPDT